MDRKEQIEKVILKELHDIEFMKKVKRINEMRSLEQIKDKIKERGGSVGAEVASRPAARNALRAMDWHWGSDSSTVEDPTDDASTNSADAAENAAARARLGAEPKQEAEPASPEKAERIEREIKTHLDQLVGVKPELTFAKVVGKGVKTSGVMSGEEVSKHLSDVDSSHPHLGHVTSSLRKLLGVA
jgi:hypothetical protein